MFLSKLYTISIGISSISYWYLLENLEIVVQEDSVIIETKNDNNIFFLFKYITAYSLEFDTYHQKFTNRYISSFQKIQNKHLIF